MGLIGIYFLVKVNFYISLFLLLSRIRAVYIRFFAFTMNNFSVSFLVPSDVYVHVLLFFIP